MKPKLSEFMATEIPNVDFETIKRVVRAHWKYESSIRGKYCDICSKELSYEEECSMTPHDFLHVCNEHNAHRDSFDVHRVRRELGIETDTPEYFQ